LSFYSHNRYLRAEDGKGGGKNRRQGRKGKDLILSVPVGTVVYEWKEELKKWRRLFDFTKDGQTLCVAKGGEGGWGNAHFVSATQQSPRIALPGKPGEKKKIKLVLKLIAEVGLVGLPNAGKSTLLKVISRARPKVAPYPFTTLVPNLGVVEHKGKRFVVADIPGLIEGAHKGKGLGDKFLRHIERTRLLLWLLDCTGNPLKDYQVLKKELFAYKPGLLGKKRLLVLTKIDVCPRWKEKKKKLEEKTSETVVPISAVTHKGIEELLDWIIKEGNF
ncbi:GTPase ObgE, partial [bacterium]|nr:GTPase ObgE [bacterium]